MEITFPIPVLSERDLPDRLPGHGSIGVSFETFEIREVAAGDAPLAVRTPGHNPWTGYEWRLFDSKLWRKVTAPGGGSWVAFSRPRSELMSHPLACTNRVLALKYFCESVLATLEEIGVSAKGNELYEWTARRAHRLLIIDGAYWIQDNGPCMHLHGISRLRLHWSSLDTGEFGPHSHLRHISFAHSDHIAERLSDALRKRVHDERRGHNEPEFLIRPPKQEMRVASGRLSVGIGLSMAAVALEGKGVFSGDDLELRMKILELLAKGWGEENVELFLGIEARRHESNAGYLDLSDNDPIDGPIGVEGIPLLETFCKTYGRTAARWHFLPKLAAALGRIALDPAPAAAERASDRAGSRRTA